MPIKEETQQPNAGRQHPIPQNVMDVEFKVVGDLTVRQLMYLFAGGSFTYIFWISELPAFWRIIVCFISAVGTVGVAFVPYEERGLDKWFMSFLKAMTMPTQMVWRKTYSPPAYFLSDYANIIKNEIITLTPAKSRNKLDDYLGQLSESENELDRIESMRLQGIRMGFSNQANTSVVMQQTTTQSYSPSLGTTTTTETEVIYSDDNASPGRGLSDSDDIGENKAAQRQPLPEVTPEPTEPKRQSVPEAQTKPVVAAPPAVPVNTQPKSTVPEAPKQTQPAPKGGALNQTNIQKPATQDDFSQKPQETIGRQQLQTPQPKPQPKPISEERRAIIRDIVENEISSKTELLNSIEFKKPTLSSTSIDRAIINIPSNPRGEIKIKTTTKLPKTIVVQDIKELESKESSLEKKVSELLDVTKQVRSEMQGAADKAAHISKNQSRIEFFATKYQELESERAKITTQLDESSSQVKQIEPAGGTDLNKQVEDLSTKNDELKAQLAQIQAEISMLKNEPVAPTPTQPQPRASDANTSMSLNKETKAETAPQKSSTPTQNSNIITGVVKNKTGQLIDNAVVIIKDKDGDAIRALKTNQIGQFKTQTPMQNGKYTVEVIKGGMKFDIISVEAKGDVISPLYIIAYE